MDIIQGLIETGNAGKSGWRIVNNKGAFGVVNKRTSNVSYSILNSGTIGTGATFVNTYNSTSTSPPSITATPSATTTGTTGNYTYHVFTYTTDTAGAGTGQSLYTINVPSGGVVCDVLVVGGGGGGDRQIGAGGGGGAVLYATGITIPSNTYTIKVGKGGAPNVNGSSSEAFGATCLGGGSTSYVAWSVPNGGRSGGSGSGGSTGDQSGTSSGGGVGVSTKGTLLSSGTLYNGNIGGNASGLSGSEPRPGGSGGGGGAGTAGKNAVQVEYLSRQTWLNAGSPSVGGNGVPINITGTEYYWGAGGGGGYHVGYGADGGLGGGGGGCGYGGTGGSAGLAGIGGISAGGNAIAGSDGGNGGANTGSGGGGSSYFGAIGTSGGSGIVIIRYLAESTSSSIALIQEPNLNVITNYVGGVTSSSSGGGSSQWSTIAGSKIYYNNGNVGIGTIDPIAPLHIYNNTTTATLPTEIVVSGATSATISGTTDRVISFPYSGSATTKDYTFTTTENLICDILIVGGGGAGGMQIGAGGGGGAVLYGTNINIPIGNYTIKVGKGAVPGEVRGGSSEAFGATILGGGSSVNAVWATTNNAANGYSGGSGGGGKGVQAGFSGGSGGTVGTSTKGTILNTSTLYNGNVGGAGQSQSSGVSSGGGGGAGGVGGFGPRAESGGDGGIGVPINITGTEYYWAAGGGGGCHEGIPGNGGLGGGGAGSVKRSNGILGSIGYFTGNVGGGYGIASGKNAGNGTGSGGGGVHVDDNVGGNGGSGIVIIRYRRQTQPTVSNARLLLDATTTGTASIDFRRGVGSDAQNDFRFINDTNSSLKLQCENTAQVFENTVADLAWFSSNETIIHKNTTMNGRVGIGTIYNTTIPSRTLDVVGDANISGILTAGSLSATSATITNSITSNTSLNITNGFVTTLPNEITVPSPIPNEIVVSPLPTEIVVAGTTFGTIGTTDRYISFPYSGTGATKGYTFTTTENLICDILVVGGGGGGSGTVGGGGGAGALIFAKNAILSNGTYTISVGSGGTGGASQSSPVLIATKGNSSSISKDGINITAEGGGASGRADGNQNGGSGGGGDYWEGNETAGTSTSYTSTAFGASIVKYGNNGANAYNTVPYNGGGGGGAGSSALKATSTNFFSNGGSGLHQVVIDGITINFATIFGTNTAQVGGVLSNGNLYYGGGGGAGGQEQATGGTGGIGGGGNGGPGVVVGGANIPIHGSNGLPNTGGGGGGGSNHSSSGGAGGSGIIIIRYRKPPSETVTSSIISGTADRYIQFPYSGTAATKDYTITTTENLICDILIVGGGGGGGASIGSGGGGGGLLYYTGLTITANTYTISVGNGGTGATNYLARGANGSNSSAVGYTAYGGGGGGGQSWVYNQSNTSGGTLQTTSANQGSGGGGTRYKTIGNSGTTGQGNSGGNSSSDQMVAGGGGGAGGVGGTAQNTIGGLGGAGTYNSITGSSIGYAGGGAGSGGNEVKYGAFATEGGGNSGPINGSGGFLIGGAGTNGRGGGGGGGVDSGGNGGSGIIIIRYRKPPAETVTSSIIASTTDRYIMFPYSGTAATKDYTITTTENLVCDILVVGGGGGGGNDRGGGGGGGGVIYSQNITLNGTYTIMVGKEGMGTTSGTGTGGIGTRGTNGSNTSISGTNLTTITAIGGGGGGACAPGGLRDGLSGGSGGGGSQYLGAGSGGTGTIGQGNNGGIGFEWGAGGGGGGAVAVGTNANSTNAGNGGVGLSNSITGISVIYGSGGGGGGAGSGNGSGMGNQQIGTGGSIGAGNGSIQNVNANNATIFGCGGGGAGHTNAAGVATKGGNGFAGVVIIRYRRQSSNQSAALELTSSSSTSIIEPVAKGIKQFPETPSTTVNSWTDNGFTVTTKTSDAVLGAAYDVCYLFNNLIASPDHYHGAQLFNGSSPFNYTSSTSFKGANGLVLYIDLGRSITPRSMRIAPRDNTSHPTLNFLGAAPGIFKIYASNDSASWTSTTHASWTEIHSQTTSLTFNYNQYTEFGNFSTINTPYRYFALVVYNLAGNYGYLTFSEWDIFGTYDMTPVVINSDYKYLSFTYYPTVVEQKTGVSGWRLVRFLPPTATAWHPINDNLAGTTTYGTAYNYTNAWSIPFGTFDEFVFGTLNLQYWMRITKTEAIGTNYSGVSRNIIKSSYSSTPYSAIQYNRAGNNEDPWMSIRDHPTDLVYGENSWTLPLTPLVSVDGGMGVWVRNSAEALALPSQTSYTVNFPESTLCDILVVGGGGGGGLTAGGGGGAGGVIYLSNQTIAVGNYNILVGNGGSGSQNGFNSSFGANIAIGGGKGADFNGGAGSSGGSGGGGSSAIGLTSVAGNVGGTSQSGQGNAGGVGKNYGGGDAAGGGGGGAGTAGSSAFTTGRGANGGIGLEYSITGTSTYYAGGGGGGSGSSFSIAGTGGLGGGGNGAIWANAGINASPNTGSGGGGGSSTGGDGKIGGSGGSGIVIIRYKITKSGNQTYKVGNYSGEFKVISSVSNTDTDYIKITSAGAITNPMGTASWNTGSDRRIKENIERASYDKCLDNINKLELNRFNYIDGFNTVNRDKTQLGFIAQEVSDIFPKSISSQEYYSNTLNIPDLLSIDITQINYSLYGAVKKLIEINIEKDIRIITLNNRIKILKNLLNITDDAYTSNIVLGDESSITITDNNTSNLVIDANTSNIVADTIVIDTTTSNIASNE